MRVFLDANVIVSAVATRGLCADVLREVLLRHELIISEILLDEIRRVLQNKLRVPSSLVEDVIRLLRSSSFSADPVPTKGLWVADPKDNALLSAAVHAQAELFVTGDRKLLGLTGGGLPNIVSPRAFWERLIRRNLS